MEKTKWIEERAWQMCSVLKHDNYWEQSAKRTLIEKLTNAVIHKERLTKDSHGIRISCLKFYTLTKANAVFWLSEVCLIYIINKTSNPKTIFCVTILAWYTKVNPKVKSHIHVL